MGIYIRDMKIPKNCADCLFEDTYDGYNCRIALKSANWGLGERPSWCPLVEVPTPHGRLIDADAFENFIRKDWDKNDHWIADVVYSRPTIIPADDKDINVPNKGES